MRSATRWFSSGVSPAAEVTVQLERRLRTLSVITPVLDRAGTISRAVESVVRLRAMTDWQVEHLVMDGGSTDGTLEELRRFGSDVQVFSQPDDGLYEAINRGIEHAAGSYVCLLNSDDELIPANFRELLVEIEIGRWPAGMWGGAEVVTGGDANAGTDLTIETFPGAVYGPVTPMSVMLGAPIINARILRRDVFQRVGAFDTSFRIAGDREFLIRLVQLDVDAKVFDDPVYRYHAHEGSLTIRGGRARRETLEECLSIADDYARDPSAPRTVRIAARTWRAWTRFLLDAPGEGRAVSQLGDLRSWRTAPSRSALVAAIFAKAWIRGTTKVRSLLVHRR